MTKPTTLERVAILETKFDEFTEKEFKTFRDTVLVKFGEISAKIDAASLNGETPRVRDMSKRIGAPEDVTILATLVQSYKRRAWVMTPLLAANSKIVQAALWIITAAALAAAQGWIHSIFPSFP